jgi:outer membrane protein assembly factor BamB
MRYHKLNLKLIKFVAALVIVFSLPLVAVGQAVLQAASNTKLHIVASKPSLSIAVRKPVLPTAGSDWPTYLHDPQRTSASDEKILSPSNVGQLTKLWSFQTNDAIAASAAVVAGTVYVGSWDGYEYALDETTGALKWKTYLGRTIVDKYCYPLAIGVTSSATVQNGVVYVGGGDAYWYALDAKTGAVLWKVYTGDNSARSGHYNWSSPLIYNGYAYIGIASNCDRPLVQGALIQVNLKTHQIAHTFETVPPGQVGGGIWTSPSIDPATNSIFVSSGTETGPDEHLAQAVLVLDALTLTLKSWWHLPEAVAIGDSDFDTSPILFTDAKSTPLVASVNKNGYVYVFNRNNVGAGPVWKQLIDIAGMCPLCEESSVSSDTIGQGKFFVAAGNSDINGVNYRGSVQAQDPTTGKFLWSHGATGPVIGALVYANGLIIDGAGPDLEVLDAATGTRLYSYETGGPIYASPSLSHGQIFVGSSDGNLYALGLPSTPSTPSSSNANCPPGWSCQDIGNPLLVGSQTIGGGTWKVQAGGTGVTGRSDQLRFVSRSVSGDMQINAKLVSQDTLGVGGPAQLGLMVRQANDPASPYYAVFFTEHAGVVVQYRSSFGGETIKDLQLTRASLPLYLKIERVGNQFQAGISKDGTNYTLVPGSTVTMVMPTPVNAGLAVSSNNVETMSTAVYSALFIGLPNSSTRLPSPITSCPNGWHCDEIGNPAVLGGQSLRGTTWTVRGAGEDIWGASDQFHYVWQSITGNGGMSARVISQVSTSSYPKGGIMVRESLAPDSPYYAVFVEPGNKGNGVSVEVRSKQGLISTSINSIRGSAPIYLKVTRMGDTLNAYVSNDGVNWTLIPPLPNLEEPGNVLKVGKTVLVGMAVTSHDANAINTVTFDAVRID